MDDGARERAGDAVEVLHLRDDQLAQLVDVAGLGTHDDVVGAGDVLGEGHALDLRDGSGDLGGGGAVTVNTDTGVALSGDPQTLEWRCGNVDGSNFLEALIDGVSVFTPTIPLAAAYPTGETGINFQAGVNRGADAADTVQLVVLDEMSPTAFLEEFP